MTGHVNSCESETLFLDAKILGRICSEQAQLLLGGFHI